MNVVLALDLGGTRMRLARADATGALHGLEDRPTQAPQGLAAVESALEAALRSQIDAARREGRGVLAAGIAVAGGLDIRRGVLTQTPNLPFPPDYPLGLWTAGVTGLAPRQIRLINDANAFALGEHRSGAAQGLDHVIGITLGTGVGGGLIAGGRLIEGSAGLAGEIGHLVVEPEGDACPCGSSGCLETRAGGGSIARHYAAATGRPVEGAREVFDRAAKGEAPAQQTVAEAARFLGLGLTGLVNLLNPQAIVIGGSMAAAWEALVVPAEAEMRCRAFRQAAAECRVIRARLPPGTAGLAGAAVAAWESFFGARPGAEKVPD